MEVNSLIMLINCFMFCLTTWIKFLHIATIWELSIKEMLSKINFAPSSFHQFMCLQWLSDLHLNFRIKNIFSTGEYSGMYIGIYTYGNLLFWIKFLTFKAQWTWQLSWNTITFRGLISISVSIHFSWCFKNWRYIRESIQVFLINPKYIP